MQGKRRGGFAILYFVQNRFEGTHPPIILCITKKFGADEAIQFFTGGGKGFSIKEAIKWGGLRGACLKNNRFKQVARLA